jgi:hypothetical protein
MAVSVTAWIETNAVASELHTNNLALGEFAKKTRILSS